MAFIGNKEKNFRKYLVKQFGISLPKEARLFYHYGVRVGNSEIIKSNIRGEKGYAACDAGFNPTNPFIQNFGYLAEKNSVELDNAKAKEFAVGRGLGGIYLGPKAKWVVVKYKGFAIGLGRYVPHEKKIKNYIPKKRCRNIVNTL